MFIRTRARKILRDVWARKGRTALVSTAIFIGVVGTIALFSMSDILITQLETDIKQEELSMLQVSVTVEEGARLDNAAYMRMLEDYPGVTDVVATVVSHYHSDHVAGLPELLVARHTGPVLGPSGAAPSATGQAVAQLVQAGAVAGVPQAHRPVVAAAGQQVVVDRVKGQGQDRVRVPVQDAQRLAGLPVPQPDRPVVTAARQPAAGRAEPSGPCLLYTSPSPRDS